MFDIQRFADTITSSLELSIVQDFVDGDSRTFKVKNPRADLTTEDITEVDTFITANNLLIGDRDGAAANGFASVTKVEQTKVKLDLE